jgi:hypothetical protein
MAYNEGQVPAPTSTVDEDELDSMLYARHVEINSLQDLEMQRGTAIPAMFNQFYKFVQNPSSVGIETFKRMVDTDDTIGSGVDFLTTCLAARIGQYTHPNKEISDWVNKALDCVDGGWFSSLKELLSASWAGFAVQEIVWANQELGFIPKKLITMPPSTLLFETERTGELTYDGILQYQRNYNPALGASGPSYLFGFAGVNTTGPVRPDPLAKLGDFPFPLRTANTYSYLSIRIPKQKCIHYAFDAQGRFGNPYGRSLLRRAYKYYVMKDAFLQMLAVALDRKGTPLTIVYADPNHTVIDQEKAQAGVSARGNANVGLRGDLAAQKAFRNIHNDTTIILPGKKGQYYDTDFVPQDSNTQSFIAALDFCNKSLMRALLLPSLVFGSGDGSGSFALGQEHAKTFDKILDGMNAGLIQTVLNQLIKQMLMYNFPEEVWKKDGYGSFGKRQLSPEEIDKEMSILEKGVSVGAIDMNDLNDLNSIRDKMGLEPRTKIIDKPDPLMGEEEEETEGGQSGNPADDAK